MHFIISMLLLLGSARAIVPDNQPAGKVSVAAVESVTIDIRYKKTARDMQIAVEDLQHLRLNAQPVTKQAEAVSQEQKAASVIFQQKWQQIEGVAGLNKDKRDILVTHWTSASSADARNLYIWDTPEYLVFLFEVDSQLMKSPEQVKAFIERLLVWGAQSPLETLSAHLELAASAKSPGLEALGSVTYLRAPASPLLKGYEFDLAGYSAQDKHYFCVLTGKRLFPNIFDPTTLFIPERFPPLSERLKPLTVNALLKELGEGRERDAVVVDEILSRPLTPEEFHRLVDLSGPGKADRISLVIDEMVRLNKVKQFSGPVSELMRQYEQEQGKDVEALSAILRSLRGCSQVNFSDTALDLIKRQLAIQESLLYLQFRGETKEQAEALMELPVPAGMERLKRLAYRQVARRAGVWNFAK